MKFNAQKSAEKYQSNTGGDYFSLKEDGDIAQVRFMYNGVGDIEGYSVHEIEVDGKRKSINCLRTYEDPTDMCPFCKAKMALKVKYFVELYDIEADKVKIWERGRTFFNQISGLAARYNPLVGQKIEIERFGKKGDMKTTYQMFPIDSIDDTKLEDLPETTEVIGRMVLDISAPEMEEFLVTGKLAETPGNNEYAKENTSRRGERAEEPRRERTRDSGRKF